MIDSKRLYSSISGVIIALVLINILMPSCTHSNKTLKLIDRENLKVVQISNHSYVHVSYLDTDTWGKVGCNGYVYVNDGKAVVLDTPIDAKSSRELIDWISNKFNAQIIAVVPTHFHEDCLGGLEVFHEYGIPSYAHYHTLRILQNNNVSLVPSNVIDDNYKIDVGNKSVELRYFGPGHTLDNIVGYVEDDELLFGGCLVKSLNASKGFLGDAKIPQWSNTVSKIIDAYPNTEIVIPGHGKYGDAELLQYTIELFR